MRCRALLVACLSVVPLAPCVAHAQPERGTQELTVMAGGSVLEVEQASDEPFLGTLAPDGRAGRMFGPGGMFGQGVFGPGGMFGSGGVFGPGGIFGPGGMFGTGSPLLPNVVREHRSLGPSLLFGARYGYYVTDRAAVEADVAVAPSHDSRLDFSFRCPDNRVCIQAGLDRPVRLGDTTVVAYHYGGNVTFDVTGGTWRPMVLAGIGGTTFDWDGGTQTRFGFRFGGGFKGYFERLGVRAEVVDTLVLDHVLTGDAEHDLQVRGGLFVHWR